jgi:hypothetical protein
VPRCAGATCVPAGGSCASSANCCNGLPCVPNPTPGGPPYICYQGGTCVPRCGSCTINADCCAGETCIAPTGSTMGTCGPCGPPPPPPPDGGSSSGGSSSGGSSSGGSSSGGSSSSSGGTPDSGSCALYGQQCTTSADCCNGIPCTAGRCVSP